MKRLIRILGLATTETISELFICPTAYSCDLQHCLELDIMLIQNRTESLFQVIFHFSQAGCLPLIFQVNLTMNISSSKQRTDSMGVGGTTDLSTKKTIPDLQNFGKLFREVFNFTS